MNQHNTQYFILLKIAKYSFPNYVLVLLFVKKSNKLIKYFLYFSHFLRSKVQFHPFILTFCWSKKCLQSHILREKTVFFIKKQKYLLLRALLSFLFSDAIFSEKPRYLFYINYRISSKYRSI